MVSLRVLKNVLKRKFQKRIMQVSMLFQGSFNGVSRVVQRFFQEVSRVAQESFRTFLKVFLWYFGKFHGGFKNVLRDFQDYFKGNLMCCCMVANRPIGATCYIVQHLHSLIHITTHSSVTCVKYRSSFRTLKYSEYQVYVNYESSKCQG